MSLDSDVMVKMLNRDVLMALPRYAGGHDDHMKSLFIGAVVLAHYNEGDYEGTVATAYKFADGRFGWVHDSYGSCSGCDAWDGADDNRVKELIEDLARSTRVFDSIEEMKEDMRSQLSGELGAWTRHAGRSLLSMLEKSHD